MPANFQSFGTTSNRSFQEEPTRMACAPMRYKTPGPGAYGKQKGAAHRQKSGTGLGPQSGFNQTSARFASAATAVPGPGECADGLLDLATGDHRGCLFLYDRCGVFLAFTRGNGL